MLRTSILLLSLIAPMAVFAQPGPAKPWLPPGTPGSEIDGQIFHAQILLSAAGFSTGVIDGKDGASFKKALGGFQQSRGLAVTGQLDTPTRRALLQNDRASTVYVKLGPADVSGDYVYPIPKKYAGQARLPGLKYRNMLEEVAERYHTTPRTIIAINGPRALIGIGQTLRLPNVLAASQAYRGRLKPEYRAWFAKLNVDANQPQGDFIVVDRSEGLLKVLDRNVRLVAQFPVTTGSDYDPLPIGNWRVTTYAFLPPFHFQPELFWDVEDDNPDHMLPPGPNSPVGVAWLDLSKEHYGIHGTSEPQNIGRTESHGCLRLTNWDVLRLSQIMRPGFRAVFRA